MIDLTNPMFHDENAARDYFERMRWPDGPYCPHCGNSDQAKITKLAGKSHRAGLHVCNECRGHFSVTVGSVMERSHIPLTKWAAAFHLMAASKKGVSAHQLMRMLGIGSYRTAWFLAHRVREAMKDDGKAGPLGGSGKVIEADELYIGKREGPIKHSRKRINWKPTKGGKSGPAQKRVVMGLVERGGRTRMVHIDHATAESVRDVLFQHASRESELQTDESRLYTTTGGKFGAHRTVHHASGEYARWEDGLMITTNNIEAVFSVFRRGMIGVYQHCGEAHLHRYLAEFEFRHNRRSALGIEDTERAAQAVKGAAGKRLTYHQSHEAAHA